MANNDVNINCCTWNCTTIKTRLNELDYFLDNNNIDICCLNETRLSPNKKLKCKGYVVHRNDRNSQGGGVAVLIKEGIKHELLPKYPQFPNENVALNIKTHNGEITIVAVYNPPKKTLKISELNSIFLRNRRTIILGDLNAKHIAWNCPTNNKNGKMLLDYCTKNNIIIEAPFEPTFYPTNPSQRPSVIDIILLKNISITKPQALSQLSSNHEPVVFNISNKLISVSEKEI